MSPERYFDYLLSSNKPILYLSHYNCIYIAFSYCWLKWQMCKLVPGLCAFMWVRHLVHIYVIVRIKVFSVFCILILTEQSKFSCSENRIELHDIEKALNQMKHFWYDAMCTNLVWMDLSSSSCYEIWITYFLSLWFWVLWNLLSYSIVLFSTLVFKNRDFHSCWPCIWLCFVSCPTITLETSYVGSKWNT